MSLNNDSDQYVVRRMSQIMLQDLDGLLHGKREIDYVLASLKSYMRSVAEKRPNDQGWNDEIFDLWTTLEITYAVASANDQTYLTAEQIGRVEQACDRLCEMIAPLANASIGLEQS